MMTVQLNGRRCAVLTLLMFIILLGFGLRIWNLGGPDFNGDEIFHVFAGQEMAQGKPPTLPSGVPYYRAVTYTWTVALSARVWGVSEWSTRIPGVAFGTIGIVLVFLMTRAWYSSSAGLIAAFIMAVDPMHVAFSRQVRMYAMFQLAYLACMFLFFQGFETASRKQPGTPVLRSLAHSAESMQVRPMLLGLAAIFFFVGNSLQTLMIAAMSGPLAYVVVMTVLSRYVGTGSPRIRLKYAAATGLAVLAFAVLGAFTNVILAGVELATYVPRWAEGSARQWKFYTWMLTDFHPVIFGAFALASAVALTRNTKATVFVMACFSVPFVLQSLLPWKSPRYIFHIIPMLFIVFGVAVAAASEALSRALAGAASTQLSLRLARAGAAALSTATVLFLLLSLVEFRQGVKVPTINNGEFAGVEHRPWKQVLRYVSRHAQPGDVIITNSPGLARYYAPNVTIYCVDANSLDENLDSPLRDAYGRVIEYAGGAPFITGEKMLRDVMARHRTAWFVVDNRRFANASVVPSDVQQVVRREFQQEDMPGAADIVLWTWKRADDHDIAATSQPRWYKWSTTKVPTGKTLPPRGPDRGVLESL